MTVNQRTLSFRLFLSVFLCSYFTLHFFFSSYFFFSPSSGFLWREGVKRKKRNPSIEQEVGQSGAFFSFSSVSKNPPCFLFRVLTIACPNHKLTCSTNASYIQFRISFSSWIVCCPAVLCSIRDIRLWSEHSDIVLTCPTERTVAGVLFTLCPPFFLLNVLENMSYFFIL